MAAEGKVGESLRRRVGSISSRRSGLSLTMSGNGAPRDGVLLRGVAALISLIKSSYSDQSSVLLETL